MFQFLCTFAIIFFSILSSTFSKTDFIAYNCTDLEPVMRTKMYCDNFLISRLIIENDVIKKLNKYLQYSLSGINKELAEKCTDFTGVIKEQVYHCDSGTFYTSCGEAMINGSGVYRLKSKLEDGHIYFVYCIEDINGGEPWTIIQRRVDSDVSFDLNWEEYANGFGNVYNSYWLGLREVYALTEGNEFELWIYLKDFDDFTNSAFYDEFVLGSEKTGFELIRLGTYTGSAGNSLLPGRKFVTKDKMDPEAACAKDFNGGWWFVSTSCGKSHLNGEYHNSIQPTKQGHGIYWNSWKGCLYSYKYAHMAIREKISSNYLYT